MNCNNEHVLGVIGFNNEIITITTDKMKTHGNSKEDIEAYLDYSFHVKCIWYKYCPECGEKL